MIAPRRAHGRTGLPHRRPLLGVALSIVLLAAAPVAALAQAASPTIPARLTNEEFWKFMSDISEPGGYFRSDNFLSNELGFQTVIPTLLRTVKPGAIYLGVGPEQNFTYIAALKPKMAVIFDIRRGNVHAHLLYKAVFEMSASRAEFLSLLFSYPKPARVDTTLTIDSIFNTIWWGGPDTSSYRRNLAAINNHLTRTRALPLSADDLAGIEYVYYALYWCGPSITYNCSPYGGRGMGGGGGNQVNYADLMVANDARGMQRSFLATEATFRSIKEMHEKNLIVPVVGNFSGPKAIRAVGTYLKERGATVGAIYTSNVEQYLFQQGDDWRRYYENVATLPLDSTSTFIRSVGGNFGGGSGMFRLPSVLSSVEGLLTAYREGRIGGYYDVIAMSR